MQRYTRTFLLSLAMLMLVPPVSRASSDFSLSTGLALGTISQTMSDGSVKSFKMGGIPFLLAANKDFSHRLAAYLAPQILLDIINKQVVRQGVTAGLAYHLVGGARRVDYPGDQFHVSSATVQNLSIILRAGLFNYAASEPERPASNLTGSIWEIATGIEYRRDIGDDHALGLSILTTAFTIPASVQRLKSQMIETLIFWRHSF